MFDSRELKARSLLTQVLPPIKYGKSINGKYTLTDRRFRQRIVLSTVTRDKLQFYAFLVENDALAEFILNVLNNPGNSLRISNPKEWIISAFPWNPRDNLSNATWATLSTSWRAIVNEEGL